MNTTCVPTRVANATAHSRQHFPALARCQIATKKDGSKNEKKETANWERRQQPWRVSTVTWLEDMSSKSGSKLGGLFKSIKKFSHNYGDNIFPADNVETISNLPVFLNLEEFSIGGLRSHTFNLDAFKSFINVSGYFDLKNIHYCYINKHHPAFGRVRSAPCGRTISQTYFNVKQTFLILNNHFLV